MNRAQRRKMKRDLKKEGYDLNPKEYAHFLGALTEHLREDTSKKEVFRPKKKNAGYYVTYHPAIIETSLVTEGECRILMGDYREEYKVVLNKGLKKVMSVFEEHRYENESQWSSTYNEIERGEADDR